MGSSSDPKPAISLHKATLHHCTCKPLSSNHPSFPILQTRGTLELLVLENTNQVRGLAVGTVPCNFATYTSVSKPVSQMCNVPVLSLSLSLSFPPLAGLPPCCPLLFAQLWWLMSKKYLLCSRQYNAANNVSSPRDSVSQRIRSPGACFLPETKIIDYNTTANPPNSPIDFTAIL
jgi:hypothetical protein